MSSLMEVPATAVHFLGVFPLFYVVVCKFVKNVTLRGTARDAVRALAE
jgi:hypothetical protein